MHNFNMLTEKTIVVAFSALFLLTFFGRSALVRRRISGPVVGEGARMAGILSTLLFVVVNLSVLSDRFYTYMMPIGIFSSKLPLVIGYTVFFFSIVCCTIISGSMRDSWRVGIVKSEPTKLVTSGIYRRIRNPYFDFYFILYISFFFIRPSIILLALMLFTIYVFHRMVLREEIHLEELHGETYRKYKLSSGRYIPGLKQK